MYYNANKPLVLYPTDISIRKCSEYKLSFIKKLVAKLFNIPVKVLYYYEVRCVVPEKSCNINMVFRDISGNDWIVLDYRPSDHKVFPPTDDIFLANIKPIEASGATVEKTLSPLAFLESLYYEASRL